VSDLLARTSTELATLVRLLWRSEHQDAVRVTTGPVPEGHRVVERYVVVPNLHRARMLLPGADRTVRAAALLHYNRLRDPRTRSLRAGLALLARTDLDARFGSTVSICLPEGTSPAAEADLLVTSMLAQRLGHRRVHAAVGVSHAGPNSKPTLQLFDSAGQPVAFVKVGWNQLTRGLVTAEARALHGVRDDALPGIRRPRTILHEQWHDLALLASVPMPLGVRSLPRGRPPEARVHSDLPRLSSPLGVSAYWDGVRERWRGLREQADTTVRDLAVVDAYVAAVERRWGATPVEIGAWHGDWVSWNMARHGEDLWVWDWEHYAPLAPVGFDTAHFAFQQAFVAQRQPVGRAFDLAEAVAGTSGAQSAVVAATYPLEMYLRAARLHAQGASWNERFHDGALDWLSATARR
jgi:hypothetical protein